MYIVYILKIITEKARFGKELENYTLLKRILDSFVHFNYLKRIVYF